MRLLFIITGLLLSFSIAAPVQSVVEEQVSFDNPKTEKRYKVLINELRCLVCQNQSLADSDADLAKDLRRKTVEMLKAGKTSNEIRTYMTDRYGDFVLYRPPFNSTTLFLWLGPFILLLLVVIGVVINVRKRQQDEQFSPVHSGNEQTTVKVRNLLRETPALNNKLDNQTPNEADK